MRHIDKLVLSKHWWLIPIVMVLVGFALTVSLAWGFHEVMGYVQEIAPWVIALRIPRGIPNMQENMLVIFIAIFSVILVIVYEDSIRGKVMKIIGHAHVMAIMAAGGLLIVWLASLAEFAVLWVCVQVFAHVHDTVDTLVTA